MPVRRPFVPAIPTKHEPPPAQMPPKIAAPLPKSTEPPAESKSVTCLFYSGADVMKRLMISSHELRAMVNQRVLIPIPYLAGRVKPWRFVPQAVDEAAQRQIAEAIVGISV
jgi:hypothetical protein